MEDQNFTSITPDNKLKKRVLQAGNGTQVLKGHTVSGKYEKLYA